MRARASAIVIHSWLRRFENAFMCNILIVSAVKEFPPCKKTGCSTKTQNLPLPSSRARFCDAYFIVVCICVRALAQAQKRHQSGYLERHACFDLFSSFFISAPPNRSKKDSSEC